MAAMITWNAREGDPKEHTSYGVRFVDGKATKVEAPEIIAKLRGNPYFTVEEKAGKLVKLVKDGRFGEVMLTGSTDAGVDKA